LLEQKPLRVAQAILGHSHRQTTLGYTHVLPGWQREAMKRFEAVVLFPIVPKSENEPEKKDSELVGASESQVARPEGFEPPAFWFVVRKPKCGRRVFKRMESRSVGEIMVVGLRRAGSVQSIVQI
jgi:hypothetical protein